MPHSHRGGRRVDLDSVSGSLLAELGKHVLGEAPYRDNIQGCISDLRIG